jgi:retron-type reverse transcriptase
LKGGYVSFNLHDSYLENRIGTPQGSILSPLFCNILLNKLDKYIEMRILEIGVGFTKKEKKVSKEYNASRSYQDEV